MKKYLRNINRLFAFFLLSGNISVIASECPSVELNGNVIDIVLREEDNANIVYDLIIELEFVNKSDTPIMSGRLLSQRCDEAEKIVLLKSQELTAEMEEYPTLDAWKDQMSEIVRFRGVEGTVK